MKRSRFERMKANPKGDWTIGDVEGLCRDEGWTCQPPSNGTHYKVSSPDGQFTTTIPAKRPIKPFYIKLLIGMIEAGKGL